MAEPIRGVMRRRSAEHILKRLRTKPLKINVRWIGGMKNPHDALYRAINVSKGVKDGR